MSTSDESTRRRIEAIAGETVATLDRVGGGDIGDSHLATLAGGERLFVKQYAEAPPETVTREAEGLRWLAEPGVIPVARVRGVDEGARLLLLEWIEPGRPSASGEADFGRALAALHRSGADAFGAQPDNFIGSLPQSNTSHSTWAEFYAEERITPQLNRGRKAGRLGPRETAQTETLMARLPELFAPEEPPSRLHGDLWGGNRLCDTQGQSWLIDPAAYGGHREMDLAMMRLFGGFPETVFDAYEEAWPLDAGAPERVPLCQLYPLLVHVNLFGGHYVESVRRILAAFA